MVWSACLGLLGDLLSFSGGLVLAWDSIREERRLRSIQQWQETIASPELLQVTLTRKGIPMAGGTDVEMSFGRESARRATVGALLLAAGFLCLAVLRLLEMFR